MTAEYRQALIPLVEDVNRACSSNDEPKMNEARTRISEMLPEPSFGEDIRSKIVPCPAPKPPEPPAPAPAPAPPQIVAVVEAKVEPPVSNKVPAVAAAPAEVEVKPVLTEAGCFQADGSLALARLKTRVEPAMPPAVRTFFQNSQLTIKIKARIDEGGNVSVSEATGANVVLTTSMRNAVEKWKFIPMADANGPRCVDTDFVIVLGPQMK
jgi:hypothetical protein